jgi:hypothetical protein
MFIVVRASAAEIKVASPEHKSLGSLNPLPMKRLWRRWARVEGEAAGGVKAHADSGN